MDKNYNFNFENRYNDPSVKVSSVIPNVNSCKESDLPAKPGNDKFYHTTDTNKFFYDWKGVRYQLNILGSSASDSEITKELEQIKADIAKLNPEEIDSLESKVNDAANKANAAATKAQEAAATVNDKASTEYVDNKFSTVKSITNVETVENGYTIVLSDGSSLSVKNGINGAKGETGEKGADGKSFTYDMFTPEQLESLKGAKGDQGETGPVGPQGPQGPQGLQGEKGADGAGLTDEDRTKLEKLDTLSEGTFPTLNDNGDSNDDGTAGYATIDKVIAYIDEVLKKNDSETVSAKHYAYINACSLDATSLTDATVFHEYELNETGETTYELKSAEELQMYNADTGEESDTVRFTVDIPVGYSISYLGLYNDASHIYDPNPFEVNPKCATKTIGGVTYNSYSRLGQNTNIALGAAKWKITIKKN